MRRAVLPLLGVCLLMIPLLVVLLLWIRAPGERVVEGWRFAAWLSPAEARARITLHQSCQSDAQCDPPFVCFHDPLVQHGQCTGTGCRSDSECSPYGVCRALPLRGQKVAIRLCVGEGARQEGEPCLRLADDSLRPWACGPELVCAGAGWCGRRCAPDQRESCPEGFFCARGDPEGPVCQPSCEGRACPDGKQCLRQEGGVSVCVTVGSPGGPQEPCAPGRVLVTDTSMRQVGQAWSGCYRPCGPGAGSAACAEDELCHEGLCRARCFLNKPYPCLSQFCVSTDGEGNGVCLSSPEQWRSDPGWPRH